MTWQPLPFPGPGNGQYLPGPIWGAHTLGLVLTRVQVRGAEVHQLLTGPSWRKNQGEAGEKLPLPLCPLPGSRQQKPPADAEAGPTLSREWGSGHAHQPPPPHRHSMPAYPHTAGGTGKCSCPGRPRRCLHWHMRAPHSRLCSPHRSVLRSQSDRSTWAGERERQVGPWPLVSITPEFWCLLTVRPLLGAGG